MVPMVGDPKTRKNIKEKRNRSLLNEQFEELLAVLPPSLHSRVKPHKRDIIKLACAALNNLIKLNQQYKAELTERSGRILLPPDVAMMTTRLDTVQNELMKDDPALQMPEPEKDEEPEPEGKERAQNSRKNKRERMCRHELNMQFRLLADLCARAATPDSQSSRRPTPRPGEPPVLYPKRVVLRMATQLILHYTLDNKELYRQIQGWPEDRLLGLSGVGGNPLLSGAGAAALAAGGLFGLEASEASLAAAAAAAAAHAANNPFAAAAQHHHLANSSAAAAAWNHPSISTPANVSATGSRARRTNERVQDPLLQSLSLDQSPFGPAAAFAPPFQLNMQLQNLLMLRGGLPLPPQAFPCVPQAVGWGSPRNALRNPTFLLRLTGGPGSLVSRPLKLQPRAASAFQAVDLKRQHEDAPVPSPKRVKVKTETSGETPILSLDVDE